MTTPEHHGAGEKILIVEDDPAQLQILQLALHKFDYHCATFTSAEEALENCEPALLGAAILDETCLVSTALSLGAD